LLAVIGFGDISGVVDSASLSDGPTSSFGDGRGMSCGILGVDGTDGTGLDGSS